MTMVECARPFRDRWDTVADLIGWLLWEEDLSTPEIQERLGLSRGSVTGTLDRMLAAGQVRRVGRVHGLPGRRHPPTVWGFTAMIWEALLPIDLPRETEKWAPGEQSPGAR